MYFEIDFDTNLKIVVRIRVVIYNIIIYVYDYSEGNTF